jgi:hypothetical protein
MHRLLVATAAAFSVIKFGKVFDCLLRFYQYSYVHAGHLLIIILSICPLFDNPLTIFEFFCECLDIGMLRPGFEPGIVALRGRNA